MSFTYGIQCLVLMQNLTPRHLFFASYSFSRISTVLGMASPLRHFCRQLYSDELNRKLAR